MFIVCIVGMHRSGTSALTGSLQQHGLFLGEVFETNPFNKKGNRENAEVMTLNNDVLLFNHASWDSPLDVSSWLPEHEITRDKIISKYTININKNWGFKDPRSLFTLKFWLNGLNTMKVKFVGSFRHPLAVAKSLYKRNSIPIEKGIELWEQYNTRLIRLYKTQKFPLVSFDVNVEEYNKVIKNVALMLDLPVGAMKNESSFFENSLRHTYTEDETHIPHTAKQVYQELIEFYNSQG